MSTRVTARGWGDKAGKIARASALDYLGKTLPKGSKVFIVRLRRLQNTDALRVFITDDYRGITEITFDVAAVTRRAIYEDNAIDGAPYLLIERHAIDAGSAIVHNLSRVLFNDEYRGLIKVDL